MLLRRPLRWRAAALMSVVLCAACARDDTPVSSPPDSFVRVASVRIALPTTLRLRDSVTATLDVRDVSDRPVSNAATASWTSSDPSVATVSAGTVVARLVGVTTITVTVGGISASAVVTVVKAPSPLVIGLRRTALQLGDRITFSPIAGRQVAVADIEWSSSNPAVARFDAPGTLSAYAPGTTTVVARLGEVADSVTVDVVRESSGFGYYYSKDAYPNDAYDTTPWAPMRGLGYTTGRSVSATLVPPYASIPDLGWLGPLAPSRSAVLHVVSLENAACAVSAEPDTGVHLTSPGSPRIRCGNGPSAYPFYGQSVRVEFVAFGEREFSGALALVRPSQLPSATTRDGIVELASTTVSRTFGLPAVAPDSMFWFVTPSDARRTSCAIAPTGHLGAAAAVQITCDGAATSSTPPEFYATGFGANARHGDAPIGFAALGNDGRVERKAVDGLDIKTTGSGLQSLSVEISGARISEFDRVPAILVTAIAPGAASCGISEPTRTASRVTFELTCAASAVGAMVGVVY